MGLKMSPFLSRFSFAEYFPILVRIKLTLQTGKWLIANPPDGFSSNYF